MRNDLIILRHSCRSRSLLLFFLLLCTPAFGQSLMGTVVDDRKNPIEFANVVGLDAGNKLASYAITDDKGHFKLALSDTITSVRFSAVGCQTITLPKEQATGKHQFVLRREAYQIKEVVVKSRRIESRHDTLTYSVAGFRQKQDRTIGDVIAKMPGLEVGSDGSVKYQGRAINKYYIEGLDLLGRQYGMGNKNISADKIASVQVLQNHQPVKSLRGINFSDQAALNLVLKNDAKDVWSGSADIGTGFGKQWLYDNRLMALQLGRQFQTLMMYKNNDTGRDISAEIRDLATSEQGEADLSSLLSLQHLSINNLPRERYNFNHSHTLAGNWLLKLDKNTELRLQGNIFLDKTEARTGTSTTYLSIAGQPVVMEEESLTQKLSQWKGEINYQYNGSRSFIRNNLRGYMDFNKQTGLSMIGHAAVSRLTQPRRRSLTDVFELSHTTASHEAWTWKSVVDYQSLPGKLLKVDSTMEDAMVHYMHANSEIKYNFPIVGQRIENLFGVDYLREGLDIRVDGIRTGKGCYRRQSLYWNPTLMWNFSSQHLLTTASLRYVGQSYRSHDKSSWWVDPRVSYRWEASEMTLFTLAYTLRHEPQGLYDVFDIPVFSDYRTRVVNKGIPFSIRIQAVSASFQYSNPLTGLYFYLQPSWTRRSGSSLYRSKLQGNVYLLTATDSVSHSDGWNLRGRVSKAFSWAKTCIGLAGNIRRNHYQLLVENDVTRATLIQYVGSLDYSLRPTQWLSVEGKSMVSASRQRLSMARQTEVSSTDWQHKLQLFLFISDALSLSWDHSLNHTNDRKLGTNYFMDAAVRYRLKHSEWDLELNNIIGKDRMERNYVGQTLQTTTLYRLRSREIMVRYSFDIQ